MQWLSLLAVSLADAYPQQCLIVSVFPFFFRYQILFPFLRIEVKQLANDNDPISTLESGLLALKDFV